MPNYNFLEKQGFPRRAAADAPEERSPKPGRKKQLCTKSPRHTTKVCSVEKQRKGVEKLAVDSPGASLVRTERPALTLAEAVVQAGLEIPEQAVAELAVGVSAQCHVHQGGSRQLQVGRERIAQGPALGIIQCCGGTAR